MPDRSDDTEDAATRRRFLGAAAAATAITGTASAGCLDREGSIDGNEPEAVVPDVEARVTEPSEGEGVIYQYFHTKWADVESDVDRLAEAGIDAVWLPQPAKGKLDFQHLATEDNEGFYGDEHPEFGSLEPHPPLGYQPVDLREFDSAFGTEAELESLVGTAHDHGIEVIVDTVLNHVANPDPAPADRWGDAEDPTATTRLDWPQFETEEHFTHVPADGYRGDIDDPQYDESLLGLPNLDVSHPEVQAAHEAYLERIADLGVDGIRYDAAAHIRPQYFADVINPLCDDLDLWRVGEVWEEQDTERLHEYADTGMNVFDFPLYANLVAAFERSNLIQLSGGPGVGGGFVHENPEAAVTFVQNHDTPGPNVGPDNPEGELVDLAKAFILSYPGTPHLFRTTIGEGLEDERIHDLIRVKNALARGELLDRHVDRETYVYERRGNLLAGLNVAHDDRTVTVETSWSEGETLADYTEHGGPVTVGEREEAEDDDDVEITIPGRGWVMYTTAE